MRSRVASGMERPGVLLRTKEMVEGLRSRCSARTLRLARGAEILELEVGFDIDLGSLSALRKLGVKSIHQLCLRENNPSTGRGSRLEELLAGKGLCFLCRGRG